MLFIKPLFGVVVFSLITVASRHWWANTYISWYVSHYSAGIFVGEVATSLPVNLHFLKLHHL